MSEIMSLEKPSSHLVILVVGKSGSGKDTLMRESQQILQVDKNIPVNILQRYITRTSDENEESIFITQEEYLQRKKANEFSLYWRIYGNWYGCPRNSINTSIKRGELVLINVSRSILYEARKNYPHCKIVLIDVPQSIAEERVKSRGRETGKRLKDRLTRMKKEDIDMPQPNKIILNDDSLERAVMELSSYLEDIYSSFNSRIQNW